MNNPMGYSPHPLCLEAAAEVQRHIMGNSEWREEAEEGKMFGVLVVEDDKGALGFLAAYSGLLANRNDWDYFVPAVFDFQQPDGYFKREEAEISDINKRVTLLEQSPDLFKERSLLQLMRQEKENALAEWKRQTVAAKQRRDAMRSGTIPTSMTEQQMLHESQWMKAETKRLRQQHDLAIAQQQEKVNVLEKEIADLKKTRRQKSDALQKWLFDHFIMLNAKGEERTLTDIFATTTTHVPPSGAGECCAPKLLQYAYSHHLKPRCIAEFWWGKPPMGEIRQHQHFYPACRGKCLPILNHMLQGLDVENATSPTPSTTLPEIIFEDEWLLVVCKPPGMLSVPGKTPASSVYDFARHHCPAAEGPLIVHRLDMDTSGLMVIAKTKAVHQQLQAQFNKRTVEKTYIAVLEKSLPANIPPRGSIQLPLRPDTMDRPRQMVDTVHGKRAITLYEAIGENTILLHPLTGRTHQLRVHCAHPQGLATPIKGDPLYGTAPTTSTLAADRLYLHAGTLAFIHPVTRERLSFEKKPEWANTL